MSGLTGLFTDTIQPLFFFSLVNKARENHVIKQKNGGILMIEIYGTNHKEDVTDYFQRCKRCGRMFYYNSRKSNGATVICPYCFTRH